jgi:carbonic anhydrase
MLSFSCIIVFIMSHVGETFFTSVGCMDGRVQEPVLRYGQKKFGVKYADTITEAGLVGILGKKSVEKCLLESIKKKLLVSIEKHHSKNVVVHGHQECAGNPVEDAQHRKDVLKTAKIIKSLVPSGVTVISTFITRSEEGLTTIEEL